MRLLRTIPYALMGFVEKVNQDIEANKVPNVAHECQVIGDIIHSTDQENWQIYGNMSSHDTSKYFTSGKNEAAKPRQKSFWKPTCGARITKIESIKNTKRGIEILVQDSDHRGLTKKVAHSHIWIYPNAQEELLAFCKGLPRETIREMSSGRCKYFAREIFKKP